MSLEAGNILRETREQMGVSIKDASDALHIRVPYLQALENGRAEIIPSTVQARGFLRIYSEYLGLSASDVIREWDNPDSTSLSAKKTDGNRSAAETTPPPVQNNGYQTAIPQAGAPADHANPQPAENSFSRPYSGMNQSGSLQSGPGYPPPVQGSYQQFPDQSGTPADVPLSPNNTAADNQKADKKQKKEKKKKEKQERSHGFSLFKKRPQETQAKPDLEESAQDLFNDIGSQLSDRRTLLALSLEDCESQTLIRSIYLSSMESGNFEQLPSLIQARGMLNNYASFLDLDVDTIMLKFATALQLLSQKKNRRGEDHLQRHHHHGLPPLRC